MSNYQAVTVKLDYLSSMLTSLYIMIRPDDRLKWDDYFQKVSRSITDSDKKEFINYFKGHNPLKGNPRTFVYGLQHSEADSLDELFATKLSGVPYPTKKLIERFDAVFYQYWLGKTETMTPILQERQELLNDVLPRIYNRSSDISGRRIEMPEKNEFFILMGLAAIANEYKGNTILSSRYLNPVNDFLVLVAHERIGHKMAYQFRDMTRLLFGKKSYDVEEGFVHVASSRIIQEIYGSSEDIPSGKNTLMRFSYELFNSRWDELSEGRNYKGWYKSCLLGIRMKTLL